MPSQKYVNIRHENVFTKLKFHEAKDIPKISPPPFPDCLLLSSRLVSKFPEHKSGLWGWES